MMKLGKIRWSESDEGEPLDIQHLTHHQIITITLITRSTCNPSILYFLTRILLFLTKQTHTAAHSSNGARLHQEEEKISTTHTHTHPNKPPLPPLLLLLPPPPLAFL
jgi:hypothetical protein